MRIRPISWKKFDKVLLKFGCQFDRQQGSHRVYKKPGLKRPVIVPTYDPLPTFIIKNNLRTLQISNEAYLEALKSV
jgi:predicted RNA binding protein YcfA (HicA-like mRNA interferase family)